jgi:hypothetical protein
MSAVPDRRSPVKRDDFSDALANCRVALDRRLARSDGHVGLRDQIADFAHTARRLEVPPERLLVVFKTMVSRLPAVERKPVDLRNDFMNAATAALIDAYFGNADGGKPD